MSDGTLLTCASCGSTHWLVKHIPARAAGWFGLREARDASVRVECTFCGRADIHPTGTLKRRPKNSLAVSPEAPHA